MSAKKKLIGKRFGRLVVIKDSGKRYKRKHSSSVIWECKCDCGNIAYVSTGRLKSGNTKSCGCLHNETAQRNVKHATLAITKHGDCRTNSRKRLYLIWQNMNNRCNDPNRKDYKWYGAKGIKVYNEWKNDYRKFKEWALKNGYQNDLTIDRINPNGHYEPSNCQWIPRKDNARKAQKDRKNARVNKSKNIITIILPIITPSPNQMLRWHWSRRRKLQKDYGYLLNAAIEDKYKVKPKEKRRLEIISYRKQRLDPDNLYGSVKLLLDAIQQAGLIWDDSPEYLSLSVSQEINRENPRTEIVVYALDD